MALLNTRALHQIRPRLARARQTVVAVVRGDLERLDRYMVFLMPLVFASFYVLPKTEQRYLIYVGCLPPMLLYVRARVFRAVRGEPVWWLTVGLCALWLMSIAWSQNLTHESVFDTLRIGLTVALFMHACLWLAVQGKLPSERILTAVLVTAGVMGTLTICLALLPGIEMTTWSGRLVGFGWAGHTGIGGALYAFAGLVALVGLTDARSRRRAGLLVAMLALCVFYTIWTQSRGAIGAFVVAALLCAILVRPKHVLTLAGVFLVTALSAHLGGLVDFATWIERGTSLRVNIWTDALGMFQNHPVLGIGAADITPINAGETSFNSAHNIFIAMALDLGAVGLGLFVALTGVAAWRAVALVRAGRGILLFTLLVFGYGVMLVHTQTVILMPAREWLIFWLPLLLLVQETARHRAPPAPTTGS